MQKKILIIEENNKTADALMEMLGYFHFKTELARTMEDGLKQMFDKSYDLIFIDEKIFDVCALECSSRKKDAKMVLMEREFGTESISPTRRAMADTFLSKPFTQQKIFDVILELHARENLEGVQENLEILRENLKFLVNGKRVMYVGKDRLEKEAMEILLDKTGIIFLSSDTMSGSVVDISTVDLIILDIGSFDEAGWKNSIRVCRQKCEDRLPVMAMIDPEAESTVRELKTLGVQEFLFKPVDPEKFYMQMMEYLVPEENG